MGIIDCSYCIEERSEAPDICFRHCPRGSLQSGKHQYSLHAAQLLFIAGHGGSQLTLAVAGYPCVTCSACGVLGKALFDVEEIESRIQWGAAANA